MRAHTGGRKVSTSEWQISLRAPQSNNNNNDNNKNDNPTERVTRFLLRIVAARVYAVSLRLRTNVRIEIIT
jgi:hypothetical protein